MREITKRETLLDCLEHMRVLKRVVSVDRKGIIPLEGFEDLYFERERKCCIIQELIQALESEPVRAALAEWQVRLMEGEKPTLEELKENGRNRRMQKRLKPLVHKEAEGRERNGTTDEKAG